MNLTRSCNFSSAKAKVLLNLNSNHRGTYYACVDGGADTGLFNPDHIHVESVTQRTADLHMVGTEGARTGVKIGTVLAAVSIPGEATPVLLVFHEQMIGLNSDVDIISCNQVREFGHRVFDTARKYGGNQSIELQTSGSRIPLQYRRALMCLPFRQPTTYELQTAERIVMTSDAPWDPECLHDPEDLSP